MRLDMTWEELARVSGGIRVAGDPAMPVATLSTDTRTLSAGQVFWALKGPRFDAHRFVTADLARISAGWVVEKGGLAHDVPKPAHLIEVPDTLKALQALAAAHRKRFDIPIVGITGSNGKTTTKEMLLCICRRLGPTCANSGNLNNQLGVPMSLLELTDAHRYGIFEMGASRPGDIRELGLIAQPTLAVLTNIGPAHIEFFKTLESTFQTKSELLAILPPDGRAALNIDDPYLTGLEARLGGRAVTFGTNPRARVSFTEDGSFIIDRHRVPVALKVFGALSRYNAAAAAAAAWALGIDAETIRLGLEDYKPAALRLERRLHPGGCEFVLDAYNANPASMRASIEAFCGEYAGKGKVLVLGDMKELGPEGAKFHRELGLWLAGLPLKSVYLAGAEMRSAADALKSASFKVRYGAAPEEWLPELREEVSSGNAVLFKASRAMSFELLAGKL